MTDVVHSHTGTTTPFDAERLHASIAAACYSVRLPEGVAEDAATRICQVVTHWCNAKPEVTSGDIRRKASEVLSVVCPEAGYFYKHQHTIL